jgi:Polysaccharide lyase
MPSGCMTGLRLATAMAMGLAAGALPAMAQDVAVAYHDGFEKAPLARNFWSLYRMGERRHWIERHVVHKGKGALAIRIKGSDYDTDCACQISEIRETRAARLNFGSDVWYGFSFRIEGFGGMTGSTRWQIGGWKQEADGSPFLAQRFDDGVFHITLESGTSRVLVATAQGDSKGFFEAVKTGLVESMGFVSEPEKYDGKDDITLVYGEDPILPDPRKGWVDMVYHIKGGLNGDGLVEVYANGRFIARATGTIGLKDAGGPTQYFRFGHNRAPMPGTATIYLDNFRRGTSRADVDPASATE